MFTLYLIVFPLHMLHATFYDDSRVDVTLYKESLEKIVVLNEID